jgi:hypothetical protein
VGGGEGGGVCARQRDRKFHHKVTKNTKKLEVFLVPARSTGDPFVLFVFFVALW